MVYGLNLTNDCLEVCLDGNKRIFVSIMDLKQL